MDHLEALQNMTSISIFVEVFGQLSTCQLLPELRSYILIVSYHQSHYKKACTHALIKTGTRLATEKSHEKSSILLRIFSLHTLGPG